MPRSDLEPEFLALLENHTVIQGRDVSFTCVVNHLQSYKVIASMCRCVISKSIKGAPRSVACGPNRERWTRTDRASPAATVKSASTGFKVDASLFEPVIFPSANADIFLFRVDTRLFIHLSVWNSEIHI